MEKEQAILMQLQDMGWTLAAIRKILNRILAALIGIMGLIIAFWATHSRW